MTDILDLIKQKVLIFDGAMGTSIQNKHIDTQNKDCPEYLNITHPKIIAEIHSDFLSAGADIIETNTFGAIPYLLIEYGLGDKTDDINKAAVQIALETARSFTEPKYVSGSIGPGTKLPSLSQITYKQLYENYCQQAMSLISEGVHLIQIETGQDPLQMKIALKAVLDVKEKLRKPTPIFLQATLQDNGQMLVGTDLRTFINTFKDMPVDALGINCGTGPQHIESYVKILSENCPKYISVLPNAGLPKLVDGHLSYDLSPEEFGRICGDLVTRYRINAIGGCCGTTTEYIRELAKKIRDDGNLSPSVGDAGNRPASVGTPFMVSAYLTSLFSSQEIKTKPAPLIIGERANVNGSKKFKTLLQDNNWEAMVETCQTQQEEGAHVLDICLTAIGRDEPSDMQSFVPLLNRSISTPLMIDSTNYDTINTALQNIAGKCIVNSINFEHGDAHVIRYITLCRDLNAALVCLTIDEKDMARTFEHKIQIVNRFLALCDEHHFPRGQVFIDCLTFALSTGDEQYRNTAVEAIKTIHYINEHFPEINTVMGISNVSFGLKPKIRKVLNSVFLHECVKNGLTATIVDPSKILPLHEIPEEDITLCMQLIYNDYSSGDPLQSLINRDDGNRPDTQLFPSSGGVATKQTGWSSESPENNKLHLRQALIKGQSSTLPEIIAEILKDTPPLSIINDILIPAMQEVGVLFESGKLQLPFVLKSAEVMKKSVDLLKPHMTENATQQPKSLLLATVAGDVHDIGKNLVQIIVENNGYKVIDIGVKQSPESIYQAILQHNPSCLGLSALLIKSTEYMRETLAFLKSKNISIPVICGGAALNEDFVKSELQKVYDGSVVYGKDAFAGLRFVQGL